MDLLTLAREGHWVTFRPTIRGRSRAGKSYRKARKSFKARNIDYKKLLEINESRRMKYSPRTAGSNSAFLHMKLQLYKNGKVLGANMIETMSAKENTTLFLPPGKYRVRIRPRDGFTHRLMTKEWAKYISPSKATSLRFYRTETYARMPGFRKKSPTDIGFSVPNGVREGRMDVRCPIAITCYRKGWRTYRQVVGDTTYYLTKAGGLVWGFIEKILKDYLSF